MASMIEEAEPPLMPGEPAASPTREKRLSWRLSLGFGVGTVGVSCLLNPISIYFPAMLATVLGLSPAIAGALLTFSKLYDIAADVAIGAVSDRTRSRWGRRRPYMFAGGIVGAISFALIFNPPAWSGQALIIYLGLALLVYSTGYSLFNIPYLAMPAEMTDDPGERTRLISYRTFFISVGQMISVPIAASMIAALGGAGLAYGVTGAALAAVILLTTLTTVVATAPARRVQRTETATPVRLPEHVRMTLQNRPFVLLMSAKLFVLFAQAATATCQLLFFLNVLNVGYSGQIWMGLATNVALALSLPLWMWAIARWGKRSTYLVSLFVQALLCLTWLIPDVNAGVGALVFRGALTGALIAGITLTGTSMLPDTMTLDYLRTGQRREGVFSSIYAAIEKAAFAGAPAVIGLYLTLSGYVPSMNGAIVEQPDSARTALLVSLAIIPAVAYFGAMLMLRGYRLDDVEIAAAAAKRESRES